MKYLAWLGGIIVTLLVVVYVMVFTSIGNGIVQPIVEEKIQAQTKLDSKLSTFSLSMSDFSIVLEINKENIIYVDGTYSLFSQSFNINYKVKMDKVESLKSLTNAPARGIFHTQGTVKGDMSFIEVDGISDVANSDTTYHVELTDLNPTSIIAKIKDAKLASLLYLGGQSAYAVADLNLDINFKNIKPHQLDGNIELATTNGKIDKKIMKKDFEVNLPNTSFNMNLKATLKGDDLDYIYALKSNLVKIKSSGKVIPEPLQMDIDYNVNIKELAVLKPITGADVRGSFRLDGKVKGSKEKLVVDGKSDFASSDTKFEAILKDFAPASVKATMKNLKLSKVLYMVKQPHYADGIFSLDVDITDAKMGQLKGVVNSSIKKGLLDSKYMTKAYEFKTRMPKTTFKLKTNSVLAGNIVDTKVDLDSSLANFDIKRARFDVSKGSLVSDYLANIPNLDKLFFATDRHLKGAIAVNGELSKDKDLDLTIHSKVADGKLDAKLHNDNFHADLKSVQTLKVLHMLIYPEIFKSSLNGKVDYNLATQKGVFNGHLVDGKFTENKMFGLLKKYARVDLYREIFKGDVSANLNKEKIIASLDLKSRTASIVTKNTKLNSKTKVINSKVDIVANKNPITVNITRTIDNPKIDIDANALVKSKAKNAIAKELGKKDSKAAKLLEKHPEVSNLLKSFF